MLRSSEGGRVRVKFHEAMNISKQLRRKPPYGKAVTCGDERQDPDMDSTELTLQLASRSE
jgi:hypothetical protein